MRFSILFLFLLLMISCNGSPGDNSTVNNSNKVPVYTYEIVKEYNHDRKAFTQGLVFHNGFLYEGTGGKKGDDFDSSLRKVEIETGKVLQKFDLSDDFFGEGIVILNDKIYQLTWREGVCFVYNLADFKLVREFRYNGEGWGLTTDGTSLIMSDGSQILQFKDPETFERTRTLVIKDENGQPVYRLNELEYIKGEIWANVWQQGRIARIDPEDGKLLGWIDLTQLANEQMRKSNDVDVLNGIAYRPETGTFLLTGKLWPKLFEVKIVEPARRAAPGAREKNS